MNSLFSKSAVFRRFSALSKDPPAFAATLLALFCVLSAVGIVMLPWLRVLHTFGFHDWDVQTSHRYLAIRSLVEYHELPLWNPYACGGFPSWGFVEGGTIVVSPWLLGYLVLPMALAIRVEVLGMALLSAFGAYAAASRFTKSHAARAFVVAVWAVNGRWALQTAAGHTWHLAYAFLPWAIFFYERARAEPHKKIFPILLGWTFAALVYAGGIYPLPHTILVLGIYATVLAISEKSARPILILALAGMLGVCLAMPKLLPMIETFKKAPRLLPSTEVLDPAGLLTLLTSRDQGFGSRPARVPAYGWHEWGMYISWAGVTILGFGLVLVQGRREAALKVVGFLLFVLGLGAFHPQSPWALLHEYVPVFKSQHVPSRFLYPGILVLALVAASGAGRYIERLSRKRPWIDAAACVLVLFLAVDVAGVAQKPMSQSMWMVAPDKIPQGRSFHFEKNPPFNYKVRDWAGPMYLAMIGNTGVLDCYGAPPFEGKGAIAKGDPKYRGEAYLAEGEGSAKIVAFTPNAATIEVEGATAPSLLVYNMNYDPGWTSSVGRVEIFEDKVAVRIAAGTTNVVLKYRPKTLWMGIAGALAALVGIFVVLRAERREERGEVLG